MIGSGEAFDPLNEHAAVPGAVEDRHSSPAGQRRPEAPKEVVAGLVVRRRGELRDANVAGIQRGHEPFDRAAFSRRVPTLEHDAHGRPDGTPVQKSRQREAQRLQARPGGLQPSLFLDGCELEAQVELVEPSHAAIVS